MRQRGIEREKVRVDEMHGVKFSQNRIHHGKPADCGKNIQRKEECRRSKHSLDLHKGCHRQAGAQRTAGTQTQTETKTDFFFFTF